MSQNILQSAIRCGIFERNISLKPFKERVAVQSCVVPSSVIKTDQAIYMLCEKNGESTFMVLTQYEKSLDAFTGESYTSHEAGVNYIIMECPVNHANAIALREALPWTAPSVLKGKESFGTGDRIGGPSQATPWHIEACDQYGVTPVLAQQSVRENKKTGRTFESVMDDTSWSVLRSGYKKPWGSDADHLKHMKEIDEAVRAGFTMFTLDPSDKIDNAADKDSDAKLNKKLAKLFEKSGNLEEFMARYRGVEGATDEDIVKSCVKYLGAIRHAVKAYKRLVDLKGEGGFNFEMSIDETLTATSPLDHRIIATELQREELDLFSLAPRFEGAFEKGIDYIGSVEDFTQSLKKHVALSKELGGYRLSLHSGSDKFSVYPAFGEITDGYYHVKTAGTSYLEAVKVIALTTPKLFREIYALSYDTFEDNVKYYEISANIAKAPAKQGFWGKKAATAITDNPDLRQVLHIAFGIVLEQMGGELRAALCENYETYRKCITEHLGKHLSLLTGR